MRCVSGCVKIGWAEVIVLLKHLLAPIGACGRETYG